MEERYKHHQDYVNMILTTPLARVERKVELYFDKGCGSFAIETKAQSFHQIDGVLSVPTARIRGDIDTPAGYLVHPRQV